MAQNLKNLDFSGARIQPLLGRLVADASRESRPDLKVLLTTGLQATQTLAMAKSDMAWHDHQAVFIKTLARMFGK